MGKQTGLRGKDIVLIVSLLSGDTSEGAYLLPKELSTHWHSFTCAPRYATKGTSNSKVRVNRGVRGSFQCWDRSLLHWDLSIHSVLWAAQCAS